MSKFQRSWLLFKSSVGIIAQHKKLLVFPVLSFVFTLFILLFFITPISLQNTGYSYGQLEHWKAVSQTIFVDTTASARSGGEDSVSGAFGLKPMGLAYAVVLYFVSMFLATFFNVAFFNEILGALKGHPVSIRSGLAFACAKLKPILLWSLFAGLIGLVIKVLEQRLEFFGRIIVRLIGMAWSVASVFAIPVLVREETTSNPIAVLKKSALTLKQTWGESLIGYVGVQFGGLLVLLSSFLLLGGALFASVSLGNFWILAVVGWFWLLGVIAFSYLTSVASQVYRCALFLYASEGQIAEPYSRELLDMAWKIKKS